MCSPPLCLTRGQIHGHGLVGADRRLQQVVVTKVRALPSPLAWGVASSRPGCLASSGDIGGELHFEVVRSLSHHAVVGRLAHRAASALALALASQDANHRAWVMFAALLLCTFPTPAALTDAHLAVKKLIRSSIVRRKAAAAVAAAQARQLHSTRPLLN